MAQKISEETVKLIESLYAQDISSQEIVQRTNVSKTTVYNNTKLKERGFSSGTEYKQYLSQKKGFDSINESEKYLAQERGFSTITEYHTYLAQERQQRPENKSLSNLINNRLKELNKTQLWLAGELGVTPQAVCKYAKGTSIPKNDILTNLFSVLKVSYNTIDDLIE